MVNICVLIDMLVEDISHLWKASVEADIYRTRTFSINKLTISRIILLATKTAGISRFFPCIGLGTEN